MAKVKEFFTKHSTELIAILVAISAFIANFTNVGGQVGAACTILVGVIAVITATIKIISYYVTNGLDDTLMKMAVALIQMIVKMINGNYQNPKTLSSNNKSIITTIPAPKGTNTQITLTKEEIEAELRSLMEK